jgi:hypothetical protein
MEIASPSMALLLLPTPRALGMMRQLEEGKEWNQEAEDLPTSSSDLEHVLEPHRASETCTC